MDDIWVFAYGSLIWDPGFEWAERRPALLRGYHRSMCIYSHVWRGTPEAPGLVLGLDRGGSCLGVAYRVAAPLAGDVVAYLDRRERVTDVYLGRIVPIRLQRAEAASSVPALTYVADRLHPQYAGKLAPDEAARLIRQGRGRGGHNVDYLESAVLHLGEMGIRDRSLCLLAEWIRQATG